MINPDLRQRMDLTEALKTMDRLQLEGGDLGALYWYKISELLRHAESYRERAYVAEEKLRDIQGILSGGQ